MQLAGCLACLCAAAVGKRWHPPSLRLAPDACQTPLPHRLCPRFKHGSALNAMGAARK